MGNIKTEENMDAKEEKLEEKLELDEVTRIYAAELMG